MELVRLESRSVVCALMLGGWLVACSAEEGTQHTPVSPNPPSTLPPTGTTAGTGAVAVAGSVAPPIAGSPGTIVTPPPTAAAGTSGAAMTPVTGGTLQPGQADAMWCVVKKTLDTS